MKLDNVDNHEKLIILIILIMLNVRESIIVINTMYIYCILTLLIFFTLFASLHPWNIYKLSNNARMQRMQECIYPHLCILDCILEVRELLIPSLPLPCAAGAGNSTRQLGVV